MELFTRDLVLSGAPTRVRSWATEIADAYASATDKKISVWSSIVGAHAGTYTWAMPVDGTAELMELSMTALGDEGYLAKLAEGRQLFAGTPRDTMLRSYTELDPTDVPSEPGNVISVTRATSRAGSLGHAVGFGMELAEYATRLTGITTMFYGTVAGSFSELVWTAVAASPRAADEMDRTMKADDEYRKLIGRGGGYFMSGSVHTALHVRLA